jgi:hypothetical protein
MIGARLAQMRGEILEKNKATKTENMSHMVCFVINSEPAVE